MLAITAFSRSVITLMGHSVCFILDNTLPFNTVPSTLDTLIRMQLKTYSISSQKLNHSSCDLGSYLSLKGKAPHHRVKWPVTVKMQVLPYSVRVFRGPSYRSNPLHQSMNTVRLQWLAFTVYAFQRPTVFCSTHRNTAVHSPGQKNRGCESETLFV